MKPKNGKNFGQSWNLKKKRRGVLNGKRKKTQILRKKDIVSQEIAQLQQRTDQGIDESKIESFSDFPLSKNTLDGLKKAKYLKPTPIQRQAIAAALQGKDILGAAKTGSGKTLAFLVPVLEVLFKEKVSSTFGMVALIITPTRELAFQIFEVLQKICAYHDFTINLIIGGKFMSYERKLMNTTNIVICTPGRLLQHLNETHQFSADEVKILVLDEADRIMDATFMEDMDRIISYLPSERQTLLFSATQTKSVKDLARLGLKDPAYISTDEHAKHSTPTRLQQSYIVCELHQKLSLLVSFLRTHLNTKTIVFVNTCKQVRFVHAILVKEVQGRSILHLHGKMDQKRRIENYNLFKQKQHVVLITTDVGARGLDFPGVTWVVQLDCPADAETYIHRVGRTARLEKKGQALLVLTPSEEAWMMDKLQKKRIPIHKIRTNPKKMIDITRSVANACVENVDLKDMAERAFRNYLFSVRNLKHFSPEDVNLESFAKSFGLFKAPRLRFLEKRVKAQGGVKKNAKKKTSGEDSDGTESSSKSDSSDSESGDSSDSGESGDSDSGDSDDSDSEDDGGGLFTVKSTSDPVPAADEDKMQIDEPEQMQESKTLSKKSVNIKIAIAKRIIKKGIVANKRHTFDDEGNVVYDAHKRQRTEDDEGDEDVFNIESAAKRLRREDKEVDRKLERERIKQKHREERLKKKEQKRRLAQQRRAENEEEVEAVLSGVDDEDDPFQYLPDPDKLAARENGEPKSSEEEESSGDDEDDDDRNYGDSGSVDDDDNEVDEGSDDDGTVNKNPRSLEDAALLLLQSRRKK